MYGLDHRARCGGAALTAFFVVLALSAMAADVMVREAWMYPPRGEHGTAAVFLTITNTGERADRLVAATTPQASRAELHTHLRDGDVMKMRRVEAVSVPAGGEVVFKPGGMHVMLFGLTATPGAGETLPLSLVFERAGTLEIPVTVRARPGKAGSAPGADRP